MYLCKKIVRKVPAADRSTTFAYGHDLIMVWVPWKIFLHLPFSMQKKSVRITVMVFMAKPRAKFIGCNFGG